MEPEIHRDLGKHDAQIDSLNHEVRRLHEDMASIATQLAQINQTLSEAKGGWRTLMMVAGFSATVGGVLVKLLSWLNFAPK